jgi:hypothetical protein
MVGLRFGLVWDGAGSPVEVARRAEDVVGIPLVVFIAIAPFVVGAILLGRARARAGRPSHVRSRRGDHAARRLSGCCDLPERCA